MKRIFLFLICSFFWLNVILGQPDFPFAVAGYPTIVIWPLETGNAYEQAFWHTNYHTSEGDIFNLTYKIHGDSIVNEKKYGKMYFYYETKEDLLTGMGLDLWGQPYGKTEYADTLLYRQDGDKVFCIPKGEDEEVLIVDYGLKVGDEFVDVSGEKFLVTETRFLKDKYDQNWTTIGCCNVKCLFFYWEPKVLELVSMTTGEHDIWVEGIGSLNWGVVPMYIAEGINPFSHLNQHPKYASVCVATPENMTVMPNINEDDYKAMLISDWKYAPKDKDLYLEYSFENDTLSVRGVQDLKSHYVTPYAECLITDNQIVFMLKQIQSYTPTRIEFSVRIPGFKPDIYQVGMPRQECVTLECKGSGTTGINEVKNEKYDDAIYDLSGRKVDFQFSTFNSQFRKKGIYIQNGVKRVVK